jgi:hypothetical protein
MFNKMKYKTKSEKWKQLYSENPTELNTVYMD